MNDKEEYNISINTLKELFVEYEKEGRDVEGKELSKKMDEKKWDHALNTLYMQPFIASFSEEPDSLPMWSTYADKGSGVAIGIERIDTEEIGELTDRAAPVWGKCAYDITSFKSNLKRHITTIYNAISIEKEYVKISSELFTSTIVEYMCLQKDIGFNYEKEIRLIKKCVRGNYDGIYFRESNGLLKPYIEYKLPMSSLKEIVVGPCADFELSRTSLVMLLHKSGYQCHKSSEDNYIEIKSSKIPYRII